jgi:hypothetical protein
MNHKKYWIILAMVWAQFACGGGGGINLTDGGKDTTPIKNELAVTKILNYSLAAVSMFSLPSD